MSFIDKMFEKKTSNIFRTKGREMSNINYKKEEMTGR
jgi:hypothetical protein